METTPVSVCTTTKNSAEDLNRLLSSIDGFADEIVIVDSNSTDGTIEIASDYKAKVFQREFSGFADIKRFSIKKASNEWVWLLDADEEVPVDLLREVQSKLDNRGNNVAYEMNKKNLMFGKQTHIKHPKRPYLARKEVLEFENELINETLSVKDEYKHQVGTLDGDIIHHAYESVDEYMNKWNRYSTLEAKQIVQSGEPKPFIYYFMYGLAESIHHLFLSGGILDGWRGIFFSLMSLNYRIAVYGKIKQFEKT